MIGETILHYEIKEKLGQGGMGEVYHAKDTRLLRPVALKVLPADLTKDERNLRRFIQEAQTASALNHPNICTIHDINNSDGVNFIVMELIEGATLRELLEDNGPMNEKDVVDIALKICNALDAVHSQGILHRDIKPENIMITDSGYLKVMDFGLAKLATDSAEGYPHAEAGAEITKSFEEKKKKYAEDVVLNTLSGLFGTVSYMSPEQAEGREIDHRSDIFSLGIVLFELLTNKRPFDGGSNATILSKIITDPVMPEDLNTGDISTPIRKIINRCLEKDPGSRYQNISELFPALESIKQKLETKLKDKQEDRSIIREPERKQMTVMFAEISNYDEIIGKTEAEEAASIMNSCFDMISAVVEEHGGRIDNIMSGTIKTLFGTDSESEAAHKDAVNTAIKIRNGLAQFHQQFNEAVPLDIKIGINTGIVILGTMGSGKTQNYMIMGDAVTEASFIKDNSGHGQILAGALTYKLTKDDFNYTEYESLSLPGKEERLPVYELLSVKEKIHRPVLGAERQIYSDMVGRDKELGLLRTHLSNLIDGKGYIVNVIGEAGIGKSRLIAEFKNPDEIGEVILLEGRALSIGKNLSFHPLRDIFNKWAEISEDDDEKKSFDKLHHLVRNIYPENSDEIIPFLATLMGMELSGSYAERVKDIKGESLEKLILKNLRELLEKAASQKPVVFIIEDLHWADNTSIEFLELLFRLAEKNRILFINVFRPAYKDTGERIVECIAERYPGYHEEIYLESLENKHGEELINNLLKIEGFSSNITDLISKRAGGNPFFIEEVIRSFIDEGVIKIENEKFVVTDKIDSVKIPETLNEVLISRIDKLDEGTKSLLKIASVIGRNFFYKIIAEAAKTTDELEYKLSYLQDVQLIKEHKRMQEIEFLFKHALAQVAVYESILIKKRKELHIKTAAAIESVFAAKLPIFYGVLSYHYSIGEDLDKAEEYLIRAGEEALKSSASGEAIEFFKSALNLYLKKYGSQADQNKIAGLELNIGLALQYKGRITESIIYFEKLKNHYGLNLPENEFSRVVQALMGFLNLLVALHLPAIRWNKKPDIKIEEQVGFWVNYNDSVTLLDPVRGILELLILWKKNVRYDFTDSENLKMNFIGTATIFSFSGLSSSVHKKMLKLINEKHYKNDVRVAVWFRLSEQDYKWVTGFWKILPGKDYDDNLANDGLKIGSVINTSLYINQYLLTKIETGDFNHVEKLINKLSVMGDDFENGYVRNIKYYSKTRYLLKTRRLNEAIAEAREGLDHTARVVDKLVTITCLSYLGRSQVYNDNWDEAEKFLAKAENLTSKLIPPWYMNDYQTSQLVYDLYRLEFSLNDNNAADISEFSKKTFKSARDAIKTSNKYAADRIEIYRLMGIYYWLLNKQKKALRWWDKSIKFGEESGGRLELSRTFMEVGKKLLEQKSNHKKLNGITAEEYLEKARSMFEDMNLQWDLDELQKIK